MKALQIRNLPDDLHRELKARAASRGQTLSDYATGILRRATESPTLEQMIERLKKSGPAGQASTQDVVDIIRADREGR